MDVALWVVLKFAGALTIFTVLASFLWNWDKVLLDQLAATLAHDIEQGDRDRLGDTARSASAALLRSLVGPSVSVVDFSAHAMVSALVAIAVMGALYFMTVPDFFVQIFADAFARAQFLKQLLFSGIIVVFITTYASFSVIGYFADRIARSGPARVLVFILFDIVLKLVVFGCVTALIYALFAQLAGSFGGDWRTGMRVVPETLEYALTFHNLSGVYVYAVLVTGFPLFLVLLVKLSVGSPLFARAWRRLVRLLPLKDKPFRFLGITLAGFASISGVLASVMFHTVRDLFQI